MNNRKIIIGIAAMIGLVVILLIIGMTDSYSSLRLSDLEELTIKEKVARLEESLDEEDITYAAIYGDRLIYGNDKEDYEYDLNQFYLSFAPYINQTHPCANHNLITCRAELKNKTFHVVVKDSNGQVIREGDYTTYSNGFAGIWLPKNIEGTITVTYGDLTATANIETYDNSNTCLTTLKLS